jgi:hypothetical protein
MQGGRSATVQTSYRSGHPLSRRMWSSLVDARSSSTSPPTAQTLTFVPRELLKLSPHPYNCMRMAFFLTQPPRSPSLSHHILCPPSPSILHLELFTEHLSPATLDVLIPHSKSPALALSHQACGRLPSESRLPQRILIERGQRHSEGQVQGPFLLHPSVLGTRRGISAEPYAQHVVESLQKGAPDPHRHCLQLLSKVSDPFSINSRSPSSSLNLFLIL